MVTPRDICLLYQHDHMDLKNSLKRENVWVTYRNVFKKVFKKENGSNVLSDGKKLGGVGREVDKQAAKLLRFSHSPKHHIPECNADVLYHCSEATSSKARHMFCDKESEWCKMSMAEKAGLPYQDKQGLLVAVREAIKPIFQNLSTPDLLAKWLHGTTQDNNEAINQFLWKHIPKTVFVGYYTFEIGMCSAVLSFNSGVSGLLKVFKTLKIKPGYFTGSYCSKQDGTRIKKMERKTLMQGKRDRKRKQRFSQWCVLSIGYFISYFTTLQVV